MSARLHEISSKSKFILCLVLVNTIPVMDVVKSFNRKKNNIWGIEGYDLPRFDPFLDKPRNVKIVKDQKPNFLD